MGKKLLVEGPQEIRALTWLVDKILDSYVDKVVMPLVVELFSELSDEEIRRLDFYESAGRRLNYFQFLYNMVNFNDIPSADIKKQKRGMYDIKFFFKEYGGSSRASFTTVRNTIEVNLGAFKNSFNRITNTWLVYNGGPHSGQIRNSVHQNLREGVGSSLIHELQHAYDYHRSKGLALNLNRVRRYEKSLQQYHIKHGPEIMSAELYKEYLNFPHEVWARFSQTVPFLSYMTMDDDSPVLFRNVYFKDLFKSFKARFHGWDVLGEDMKKRLIKALVKYHDHISKVNNREFKKWEKDL